MEMDEPVLNTQVMMYSNKEKKLLYSDELTVEPRRRKATR